MAESPPYASLLTWHDSQALSTMPMPKLLPRPYRRASRAFMSPSCCCRRPVGGSALQHLPACPLLCQTLPMAPQEPASGLVTLCHCPLCCCRHSCCTSTCSAHNPQPQPLLLPLLQVPCFMHRASPSTCMASPACWPARSTECPTGSCPRGPPASQGRGSSCRRPPGRRWLRRRTATRRCSSGTDQLRDLLQECPSQPVCRQQGRSHAWEQAQRLSVGHALLKVLT